MTTTYETALISTPLRSQQYEVELIADEGFVSIFGDVIQSCPMYGRGTLEFLSKVAKERVTCGYDCIFLWTGERREGKSTAASRLHLEIDSKFPVDNVSFHLRDFNHILSANPEADPSKDLYPQGMLDEAGKELYAGDFAKKFAKSMVKKFQVIGKKKEIVSLILPHKMFLVRGMRETLPSYWINVENNHGKRGYAVVRKADPNCHRLDKFWIPWFVFKFDELSGPWWDAYQKKKDAFIDETCRDESDIIDKEEKRLPTVQEVADAIGRSKSWTEKEIARAKKEKAVDIPG
jgi:hypothetical protein